MRIIGGYFCERGIKLQLKSRQHLSIVILVAEDWYMYVLQPKRGQKYYVNKASKRLKQIFLIDMC